jgi:hypothetical protein
VICPVCGHATLDEHDDGTRWCTNCHGLTSESPPDGLEWVTFVDRDSRVLFGRLIDSAHVERGSTYHRLVEGTTEGIYDFDGERYVRR